MRAKISMFGLVTSQAVHTRIDIVGCLCRIFGTPKVS